MSELTPQTTDRVTPRGGMHFAFILTMPNNNAWNGRWSGEGKVYAKVKTFTTREFKEQLLQRVGNHYHNFGDGWGANVEVKVVSLEEKRKLIKQSQGFCGYEWMINSIIDHGEIRA